MASSLKGERGVDGVEERVAMVANTVAIVECHHWLCFRRWVNSQISAVEWIASASASCGQLGVAVDYR